MKRYTFRVGDRQQHGIELHVASVAEKMEDAVRLAQEQLYEQLDTNDRFKVDLDFGLQAHVEVNVKNITEDNLVSIETLYPLPAPAVQLALDLQDEPTRDEMNDFMEYLRPGRLTLVPLADAIA